MPTYRYPRPSVTVDIVVFAASDDGVLRVLLVQRKAPPYARRWALPGGFVDPNEDLQSAARRELREETDVAVRRLVQLGAYGTPGRDPRGHSVTVAFFGATPASDDIGCAGDDARALRWCAARRPPALAFDHRTILRDARRRFVEMASDPHGFADTLFTPSQRRAAARLRRAAGVP